MFKSALKNFEIDVKKMPLGKLSKTQIAKGFEVLEEIEEALKAKKPNQNLIYDLSSKFYTVIPQDFGRQRPPPINDQETLQKKYDMLTVTFFLNLIQIRFRIKLLKQIANWIKVLSDIELAQSMQEAKAKETVPDVSLIFVIAWF